MLPSATDGPGATSMRAGARQLHGVGASGQALLIFLPRPAARRSAYLTYAGTSVSMRMKGCRSCPWKTSTDVTAR